MPRCNNIIGRKSLSDNESVRADNDYDDDDDFSDGGDERVTDELLAANLDRRPTSTVATGSGGNAAERRAKPSTTAVKKVSSGACKLFSSLMSAPLGGVRTVGNRGATPK